MAAHIESMNSRLAYYSAQVDQALDNGNVQEAFALSVGHSVFQNRATDRLRHEQNIDLRDDRQKKVNEYALTHGGFGMNSGTSLTGMQAASSFASIFSVAGQPAAMAFGGLKSLMDEGNTGTKIVLQNNVDDLKRVQDELRSDAQRSQSATAEAINMLKQLNNIDHDTKTQMTRG